MARARSCVGGRGGEMKVQPQPPPPSTQQRRAWDSCGHLLLIAHRSRRAHLQL